MTMNPTQNRALRLLADLLSYPTPQLAARAQACTEALAEIEEDAAEHIRVFAAWAAQTPRGRQEEFFTRTFDLQAICFPYVSYHLFGESYKRGGFLARLNEEYRRRGFATASELPDHLAVLLRFLAEAEEDEVTRDLTDFCLAPALQRMDQAFGGQSNPYRHLIQALIRLFPPAAVGMNAAPVLVSTPAKTTTPVANNGCGPNCTHLNPS